MISAHASRLKESEINFEVSVDVRCGCVVRISICVTHGTRETGRCWKRGSALLWCVFSAGAEVLLWQSDGAAVLLWQSDGAAVCRAGTDIYWHMCCALR